mgnify:CR=1 FL=1
MIAKTRQYTTNWKWGLYFLIFAYVSGLWPLYCYANVTIDSVRGMIIRKPFRFDQPHRVLPSHRDGGTINLIRSENMMHYNPFSEDLDIASNWYLCFDSLMIADDFDYGIYHSLIASDIQLSNDKKQLSVTINDEAQFSNGESITSDDVIASLSHFRSNGQIELQLPPALALSFSRIDTGHLKIKSQVPMTIADVLFIMQLPITQSQSLRSGQQPVTSGVYQIASLRRNQFAVLQKNPLYWAKSLPLRANMFHFNTIKFVYVKSRHSGFELFKRRSADYRWEPFYEDFEQLKRVSKNNSALKLMRIPVKRPVGVQGFVYNQHRSVWQNQSMRRAISLAFDFERLNSNLFNNEYTRFNSFFTNTPYASPVKHHFPFDLEKADQLLSDLGWRSERGRRVNRSTGRPLSIKLLVDSVQNEKIATIFAKNLHQLGIQTTIHRVDVASYIYQLRSGDFDLAYFHLPVAQTEPRLFVQNLVVNTRNPFSFGTLFGIRSPKISSQIKMYDSLISSSKKVSAIQSIDTMMMDSDALIPMWYPSHDRFAYWDIIDGFDIPLQCRPKDNFKYWWSVSHQSSPKSATN